MIKVKHSEGKIPHRGIEPANTTKKETGKRSEEKARKSEPSELKAYQVSEKKQIEHEIPIKEVQRKRRCAPKRNL